MGWGSGDGPGSPVHGQWWTDPEGDDRAEVQGFTPPPVPAGWWQGDQRTNQAEVEDSDSAPVPDRLRARRPIVVTAITVLTLGLLAAGAVVVMRQRSGSGVAAPRAWPKPTMAQAAQAASYLKKDGRSLHQLAGDVEALATGPTRSSCRSTIAHLAGLDPSHTVQSAIDVPDPILRGLYVTLTADVTAALGACRGRDRTAMRTTASQLSSTLAYIAARNDQIEAP